MLNVRDRTGNPRRRQEELSPDLEILLMLAEAVDDGHKRADIRLQELLGIPYFIGAQLTPWFKRRLRCVSMRTEKSAKSRAAGGDQNTSAVAHARGQTFH